MLRTSEKIKENFLLQNRQGMNYTSKEKRAGRVNLARTVSGKVGAEL